MNEMQMNMMKRGVRCYVALPTMHKKIEVDFITGLFKYASRGWMFGNAGNSALTYTFNSLWCQALSLRDSHNITHFIMVHEDIVPKNENWADILIEESLKHDADIVSAISPIKEEGGRTSTGFAKGGDKWNIQTFTLDEIWKMPDPTFTVQDIVVNTGLMIVDITKPWVNHVCFHVEDKMWKTETGEFQHSFVPEDWNFSLDAQALGAKVMATRLIEIDHWGIVPFHNIAAHELRPIAPNCHLQQ